MTAEISAAETERHSRHFRLAGQLWERTRLASWFRRLAGRSPTPLSAPCFSRNLHQDVDLTFVDLCWGSRAHFSARRFSGRPKGPRGDEVAWPERGSPLGPVVLELPG